MLNGQAKVIIGLGGNFAAAAPDTQRTYQALQQCDLTVHISTKLNRSHIITGKTALILPCLGRTEIDRQASGEQCITVEDSMSIVKNSRGRNEPASESLKSETAIIAAMASATLGDDIVPWRKLAADYELICDEIAAVIPGFSDFNAKVAAPSGFYLQNPAAERQWQTPTKKALFSAVPLPHRLAHETAQMLSSTPILTLQTMCAHDQYNNLWHGRSLSRCLWRA